MSHGSNTAESVVPGCPTDRAAVARLLIECSRPHIDSAASVRAFARIADWSAVESAAREHGLRPALYSAALSLPRGSVPPAVMRRWTAENRRLTASHLPAVASLGKLAACLSRAGIPVFALKGPALAARIHGSPLGAEYGDLDLLVSPEWAAQARAELERNRCVCHDHLPADLEQIQIRSIHKDRTLFDSEHLVVVELHWAVGETYLPGAERFEHLWSRRAVADVNGSPVAVLGPTDEWLYLCLHGARHGWGRLKMLQQAGGVWHRLGDAERVASLSRARTLGLRRMMLTAAALLRDVYGVDLPEPIARAVADDPAVRELAELSHGYLWVGGRPEGSSREERRYQYRSLDRALDRLRFLMRWVFTPTTQDALSNHRLPYHLYYLIRPLRLAAKWVLRG